MFLELNSSSLVNSIIFVFLAVPRKLLGQNHFQSALGGRPKQSKAFSGPPGTPAEELQLRTEITCLSHSHVFHQPSSLSPDARMPSFLPPQGQQR